MNYCRFRNDFIKRMANTGGGLLPAEYQQVEYLQSTGNNWIDTGINVSNSLLTSCDIAIVSGFSFSNFAYIFGVYVESTPGTRYSCAITSTTSLRLPNAGNFSNYTIPTISYGQKYSLSYRFGETKWESNTVSAASSTIGIAKSLWLFARNFKTEITSKIQIYHAQLGTSSNATAYRDLYPCYRKADNVTGMYDLINNEFIPYSGTENFITGNPV